MKRTIVFCRTRFEGFHHWPGAPEEVRFLRALHRHEFHVELGVEVTHDDRDVEFILLKRKLDQTISMMQRRQGVETWSCETWAKQILETARAWGRLFYCEVSEDGENGARVEMVR